MSFHGFPGGDSTDNECPPRRFKIAVHQILVVFFVGIILCTVLFGIQEFLRCLIDFLNQILIRPGIIQSIGGHGVLQFLFGIRKPAVGFGQLLLTVFHPGPGIAQFFLRDAIQLSNRLLIGILSISQFFLRGFKALCGFRPCGAIACCILGISIDRPGDRFFIFQHRDQFG